MEMGAAVFFGPQIRARPPRNQDPPTAMAAPDDGLCFKAHVHNQMIGVPARHPPTGTRLNT